MKHEGNEPDFPITVRPPKGHPIYDKANLDRDVGEWFRDYLAAAGQDPNREWVIPIAEVTVQGSRYYTTVEGIIFEERGSDYRLVSLGAFEDEEKDPTLPIFEPISHKVAARHTVARTIILTPDEFHVE